MVPKNKVKYITSHDDKKVATMSVDLEQHIIRSLYRIVIVRNMHYFCRSMKLHEQVLAKEMFELIQTILKERDNGRKTIRDMHEKRQKLFQISGPTRHKIISN
jgi:CRISPR/Cas system CMR-associated protein Cmr1 (group 7 of RAMP superfamily)